MKKKLIRLLRNIKAFLLNPHLVICFAIAWIITNGWAYAAVAFGTFCEVKWLTIVGATYLALLYTPLCAEGILTFLIAIGLMKLLFPDDQTTLRMIRIFFRRYKVRFMRSLRKRREKKKLKQIQKGKNNAKASDFNKL